jgi:hypothetical protein
VRTLACRRVRSGDGNLQVFVTLYLNDEDVPDPPAREGADGTRTIIPSVAGGC